MKHLKTFEKYNETELEKPELADLNKDGVISEYEEVRGKAIEDSIKCEDCDCTCEECTCEDCCCENCK